MHGIARSAAALLLTLPLASPATQAGERLAEPVGRPLRADVFSLAQIRLPEPLDFGGTTVPAGSYRVSAEGGSSLRLGAAGEQALVVPASATRHEETVAGEEAMLTVGERECRLLLLRADGSALVASCSRSSAEVIHRAAQQGMARLPRAVEVEPTAVPGTAVGRHELQRLDDAQLRQALLGARLERLDAQHWAARDRGGRVGAAAAELRRLAAQQVPAGLNGPQRSEWDRQTAWLGSVADRLDSHGSRLHVLLREQSGATSGLRAIENGATAAGAMLGEMAAMNMEFLALQNAMQMESRKYQTLSNASKARHDVAMAAIRNTRS